MLPGLSVEANMAPKLAYLEQELNMTRAALRDHVLRIPAILAYSLDKRYRPRVEACRAAGVDAAYVLTAAPLTDEYFYERLETMREEVVAATASSRARRRWDDGRSAPRPPTTATASRARSMAGGASPSSSRARSATRGRRRSSRSTPTGTASSSCAARAAGTTT